EVLVTRTAKRVVRKVTKKPTANDRILGVLEKVLANQAELSKRLQAVEKPQQVHNDFININSIDIDHDSPPKQPRKKRKAP
ncbi:Agro-virD5 domain-containing protein, partial [Pyrenophora tritici-repentis]